MKRITFLVGPNGCGKTAQLVNMAEQHYTQRGRSLVIANTPFNRFTKKNKSQYIFNVSPRGIKKIVTQNLQALYGSEEQETFEIADLLTTIGFAPSIKLQIQIARTPTRADMDELHDIIADKNELVIVYSTLNNIFKNNNIIDLSNHSNTYIESFRFQIRILFKHINTLQKMKFISSYSLVFHHKNRDSSQKFEELSSGEQTLISSYLFIKSKITHIKTLFIDEPENSLHPQWQRQYLNMLHMALGYHDVQIILASHSPILVSGALSSYGNDIDVIRVNHYQQKIIELNKTRSPESVEEILWEAFDTITPVSHFLSLELSRTLQELTDNRISQTQAELKIKDFKKKSYDDTQKKLLSNVLDNLSKFVKHGTIN